MDPSASVLFSHFTSAALVVWIIQVLKNAKWFPWLQNGGQVWTKRIISTAGALAAHTGINYAWHSGGTLPTGVQYQLILNIPPLAILGQFIWRWAGQYVMQEGWYKLAYDKISVMSVPGQNPLPAPIKP
jgi:hypothetical protein